MHSHVPAQIPSWKLLILTISPVIARVGYTKSLHPNEQNHILFNWIFIMYIYIYIYVHVYIFMYIIYNNVKKLFVSIFIFSLFLIFLHAVWHTLSTSIWIIPVSLALATVYYICWDCLHSMTVLFIADSITVSCSTEPSMIHCHSSSLLVLFTEICTGNQHWSLCRLFCY